MRFDRGRSKRKENMTLDWTGGGVKEWGDGGVVGATSVVGERSL